MFWIAIALAVVFGIPLLVMTFMHVGFGRPLAENDTWLRSTETVEFEREAGKWLVFRPRGRAIRAGLIYIPGGYVHPEAYARLMSELAAAGVLCVVPYHWLRTPVMDREAPDRAIERWTEVPHWFVGGHSQGGATAAFYARDGRLRDRLDGLLLYGSAVSERRSLAALQLPALSVYGEFDGFDGQASAYPDGFKNLPVGAKIVRVEGANHAQWGAYGLHFKGGQATISRADQHARAVDEARSFVDGVLAR